MRLDGTAAIVTGAASGLGAATARTLVDAGASVFGIDLARSLGGAGADGAEITYVSADVTDPGQVAEAIAIATSAGQPVRTVINCAGIGPTARIVGRKGTHDLDMFAAVLSVNLVGTFTVMTLGAEAIAATEPDPDGQRGVIINTASIAAYDGQIGQVAYSASKGAIVAMTLPAARDLAQYGIRVCTIAPGMVQTPLLATVSDESRAGLAASVPFPRRLARPAEFAQLAIAIINHDYLNGEVIRMDGALRMAPR
ncbi:MAG: SDR family NAD(P)-dependent oxidoreductase [Actinomycetota bacterium]|nr:SDR family NAD(P)-dependent oxidoreductase [Actinomycetota bacterium]